MLSLSVLLLLVLYLGGALAFAPRPFMSISRATSTLQSRQPPFGPLFAKSKDNKEVDGSQYWQGDWVCADCGYIYDRDIDGGGKYFEEQQRGFICPQCSAPRKRYAKAVGDQWGVTRDGGDFPIYAWTFVGLAITTYFTFYVVPSL